MYFLQTDFWEPFLKLLLKGWAGKILDFFNQGVKRVYVYFNNDYNAYAVFNALRLKQLIQRG